MPKENLSALLAKAVKKYKKGAVIMTEFPSDNYFDICSLSIKSLEKLGFEGVYISFQRPFKNISFLLKEKGVNIGKLFFIDVATAFAEEVQEQNPRCIHISQEINVDDLVKAIYVSIPRLSGKKKFVFIDSLSTIALYEPLSETMRFAEFLVRTVKGHEIEDVFLIFNVANDLSQRKFIKDIAMRADEVIKIK